MLNICIKFKKLTKKDIRKFLFKMKYFFERNSSFISI